MGDMTDGIMDGDFCQNCGCYMEDGQGFPRSCSDCRRETKQSKVSTSICKFCNKKFKTDEAVVQHQRDSRHLSPAQKEK